MDVKITLEGAEETIKLLDKASSLIKELRSVDTLSKSINGTRKITADEFIKICKALEVSAEEIATLTSKFANITKSA